MNQGIDLSKIYELRKSFTVIGLTGRTGAGCSDIANLLKNGFDENNYEIPKINPEHNTDRKYKIVYNYAKENFKEYYVIEYKHVIILFLISQEFTYISNYLDSNFSEISTKELDFLKSDFDSIREKLIDIDLSDLDSIDESKVEKLYEIFNSTEFIKVSNDFQNFLQDKSSVLRIEVMQLLANNVRNGGCAICSGGQDLVTVYNLVGVINKIIKGHKRKNPNYCKVVIDSLRNPLEIMFLKERYSAFYMMSVNSEEEDIEKKLMDRYKDKETVKQIIKIDEDEYKGGSDTEFHKQNVSECIQKSDIHISNITEEQAENFNKENKSKNNNTSPKFSLHRQLLKFVSLIEQPGIITPSPEERCMQIAYTAKYNSGCISRQVGAVITDENYSIKAIGWNNTPEGQVPCLLRSADDLLINKDEKAFSEYEKSEIFQDKFKPEYNALDRKNLNGRNVSYCFKCIQNGIKEGKNQVHTRSLHAEESAFLQISKYGGQGIKGGKLFTTASPCELCSKKAYQLGIDVIYYIDLYPGISISHILKAGSNPKELRLFHGAIGNAYHKLYSPFMAYKDELSILTGIEFKDIATTLKLTNQELTDENAKLKLEIESLKSK